MDALKFNPKLMIAVFKYYKMDARTLHGPDHWLRVGIIGLALAEKTGADKNIIRYFSQLHDVGRVDDGTDVFHGIESAHFCKNNRKLIKLDDAQFDKLIFTIAKHPTGKLSDDITIGTAWDSDRCDIGRVGLEPDKKYLSTKQAKEDEFFNWASQLHNTFTA